jgi:hypothetical protein
LGLVRSETNAKSTGLISTAGSWFNSMMEHERRRFMSQLRLHRPPRKVPWWQKQWDSFKRKFPDQSGEQARTFVWTLIVFAAFVVCTRLFFAWRGLPV